MKSPRFPLLVLPLLTLFAGWQLGRAYDMPAVDRLPGPPVASASGTVISDPKKETDLSGMWEVWRLLMTRYVHPDELQKEKMVYGAIRGMVAAIGDPYTTFMTPKENSDFHDMLDGHLEGIGAQLELKNGAPFVVGTIKKSPAEAAGLLPQDRIHKVDGKTLENLGLDQIVSRIRGKKGTTVRLDIFRNNELSPRIFTIVRDNITVPSTEYTLRKTPQGNIGILAINEFGTDTILDVRSALQQAEGDNLKGLIIDLRFNGGGYLEGAVALSSMFLKEGTVVTVAGREENSPPYTVSGKVLFPDLPLAILMNRSSASASEIFAGAMKDHRRGTVIGTQSYGKGTVQEVIDLENGGSLRVTVARWLTPNGTDLGKVGITPDIAVDMIAGDFADKKDPQLDAAVEFLTTGKVAGVRTGTGAIQ